MPIIGLNPYLNFNGTADKALAFYQSALGAKVVSVMRFSDIPNSDFPPEHRNRIMHAHLQIGAATLMLSDTMPKDPATAGGTAKPGPVDSDVQVTLHFDDPADQAKTFEALSAGGTVTYPLHDSFWGAKFGMLVDAHGIQWMFNCEPKKAE